MRSATTPAVKVLAIVQARMASTRLPGKTLMEIESRPVIQHIIERVQSARGIDDLVVATTDRPADDSLVAFLKAGRVKVFRGSENDVLDRFYQCAAVHPSQVVVRVTADDPLKEPTIIDRAIDTILGDRSLDYCSNTIHPTYPEGLDV